MELGISGIKYLVVHDKLGRDALALFAHSAIHQHFVHVLPMKHVVVLGESQRQVDRHFGINIMLTYPQRSL